MAQYVTDEELVRQYYQADEQALEVLFRRYKDGLLNFALRLSGNRADAEDAVSHTFMMLCDKRYVIKEGAGFKTWAYTVARNVCLSRHRSKSRFSSLWFTKKDAQDPGPIDVIDPKAIPSEQLSQKELATAIQKAVHKLPPEQKEALLLREYHGFTYEEIAQVLNCSLENVKILIYRARQQLKNLLPPVLLEEGR